ncbi:arsenic resistance protein [Microcella alkalica]|nr:arsenic resistance protein [Microcella alkalica]
MRDPAAWERHQVLLYALAIAAGAALGLGLPRTAGAMEAAITPVLAALLFVTFLAVPFRDIGRAVRSGRFLVALAVVNLVIAPIVAFALSRFVVDDRALLLGVLLVLLTPCVDYVIVFAGLAGGDRARLVASTPLLMLAQTILLPLYLLPMAGEAVLASVEPGPFVEAFLVLIALPLALAGVAQWGASRSSIVDLGQQAALTTMVPLMMLTLATVVGSQVAAVAADLPALLRVVPLYVAFLVLMPLAGLIVCRMLRLDTPGARSVTFSGATRNSLVVLPLALALPAELALAPLVVVTQTLIELVGMIVLVRLVPRLLPSRGSVER